MLAQSAFIVALCLSGQRSVIVVGGQSLSAGGATASAVSTTQALGNTMVTGIAYDSGGTGTPPYLVYTPSRSAFPFSDLVEASVESPRSGMANYYATATGRSVHVISGSRGAAAYVDLKKGTEPWRQFEQSMESVNARTSGGATCVAFYVEHGESDGSAGTTRSQYATNLVEWQSDTAAKCRTSGRGGDPPLYIAQYSSWTHPFLNSLTTSTTAAGMYDAARANAGRIVLIGPHYYLSHAADGVHQTNTESRRMGAMAGKVIAYGPSWQPLWPRFANPVSRDTNVVTVYLYTPVPPLVVDTTNITGVSATTRGFEYTDDSSPPSITGVDCSAACSGNICSCQITLSGTPTGANKKIRYAWTGVAGNNAGPTSGPRGNIRDSDTATWQGANLYNWLVHFEESVP